MVILLFLINLCAFKCITLIEYYTWSKYFFSHKFYFTVGQKSLFITELGGTNPKSCTDKLSWEGSAYQEKFKGCYYGLNLDTD
jgi:hypothetical protein